MVTLSIAVKPVGRDHARKMEKITSEPWNLWTEDIALKLRQDLRHQDKKLTLPHETEKRWGQNTEIFDAFIGNFDSPVNHFNFTEKVNETK